MVLPSLGLCEREHLSASPLCAGFSAEISFLLFVRFQPRHTGCYTTRCSNTPLHDVVTHLTSRCTSFVSVLSLLSRPHIPFLRSTQELTALGINMVFAPCVDVNTEPSNPIIGPRSFSSNPDVVARVGWDVSRGFMEAGVMPTLKHYPGHGSTLKDSHHDLPTLPYGMDRLRKVELVPFKYGASKGVPAIMSAHIAIAALDRKPTGPDAHIWPSTLPATLSEGAMRYLRDELKFRGVMVTDSLAMGAVAKLVPDKNRLFELALRAGNDILLESTAMDCTGPAMDNAQRHLRNLINKGSLKTAMLDAAVRRIIALKLRIVAVQAKKALTAKVKTKATVKAGVAASGDASMAAEFVHTNEIEVLARNGVTVVRDGTVKAGNIEAASLFPLKTLMCDTKGSANESPLSVLVVVPNSLPRTVTSVVDGIEGSSQRRTEQLWSNNGIWAMLSKADRETLSMKLGGRDVRSVNFEHVFISQDVTCPERSNVVARARSSDIVILFMHNFNIDRNSLVHAIYDRQIELAWQLHMMDPVVQRSSTNVSGVGRASPPSSRRLAIVEVENPFALFKQPPVETLTCVYSSSGVALRIALRALWGAAAVPGKEVCGGTAKKVLSVPLPFTLQQTASPGKPQWAGRPDCGPLNVRTSAALLIREFA